MSPFLSHGQVWILPDVGQPWEQPMKSSTSSRFVGGQMPWDQDAGSLQCLPPSPSPWTTILCLLHFHPQHQLLPCVSVQEHQLSNWRIMWSPQWMGTPSSGVHVFYDRPLCPEVFFCQRDKAMLHTHAHLGRGGEKEWSSTSFEYPHHHFRERQISLSLERVKLLSLLLTSGQMMVPMAYHPHLCLPLLLLCSFSRPLCSFPFPLPQIWISTILLSDQMIN